MAVSLYIIIKVYLCVKSAINMETKIEVISASDLAERFLGGEKGKPLTLDDIQQNFSGDQREAAELLYRKMENFLKENPMLLYGEKDGKPFLYQLTEREYLKYDALDAEKREKYIQMLLRTKESEALKGTTTQGNQAVGLSGLVSLVNQDYDGKELIEGELRNGNALDVSNINVHRASDLLVKMNNAGTKEQIPQETLDKLNNSYLMTALVNGHTVSHVVDKDTYDRFAAMDEKQRLDEFRRVYDVSESQSQVVENKKYGTPQSATKQNNLQNMGIVGLLLMFLQYFGYKPEQAKETSHREVAEEKQQATTARLSTILDRNMADQIKSLAESNVEASLAEVDQQQQTTNRGFKL